MATTLKQLLGRIETKYLEPVTEETAAAPLVSDINSSETTFRITPAVLSPDELSYIGPGKLLELESEIVRVISFNQILLEAEVIRGVRNTDAVPHLAADTDVRIPTRFPRDETYSALRSAIEALWQPLFVQKEEFITLDSSGFLQLPLSTVRIISVQYESQVDGWRKIQATLLNPHPYDTAVAAVQVAKNPYGSALALVKYGVKVTVPPLVTDEIFDLPAKWERIVLADAAAELLSGVDIDALTQEFLTQQLRLERFPVRSGSTINRALVQYREYLVELAERDLRSASPRRIVNRRVSVWK